MAEAAELSKVLWDAREAVAMFVDIVETHTSERNDYLRNIVRRIDAFRREQGWRPNGFGGEDETLAGRLQDICDKASLVDAFQMPDGTRSYEKIVTVRALRALLAAHDRRSDRDKG